MGSREGFHGFDSKGRDWAFRVVDGEETGHTGGIRHILALPCFAGASVPTLLQTCIVCEGKRKHPAMYSFCSEATACLPKRVCL